MHTLSLPGMVLRGEGDATDGCLRAVGEVAAAASRRGGDGEGGGGRLQVILLPRVEVTEGRPHKAGRRGEMDHCAAL